MNNVVWAATVAAVFAFSALQGEPANAQGAPATEKAETKPGAETRPNDRNPDDAKAKAAEDRKAKTEARKAKRDAAKQARADKKAKASAARTAVRARQKECGAEWREARKAGTLEKRMTWPKFWSACNARLKAKTG